MLWYSSVSFVANVVVVVVVVVVCSFHHSVVLSAGLSTCDYCDVKIFVIFSFGIVMRTFLP